MKFEYKAKDKHGSLKEGEVDASSKESAIMLLQEEGFYIISVEEKKIPFWEKDIAILERIPKEELILFPEQMSVMLGSGISVTESLRMVSSQVSSNKFREKLLDISHNIEKGDNLSKSLEKHSDIFSDFYINIIRAGETVGGLDKSFSYLAEHERSNHELKKKLTGAMTYPLVILSVFTIVLLFLFITVMPEMIEIIEEMGELPLITQIAIAISDTIRYQGWYILLGIFLVATIVAKFFTTKQGKDIKDRMMLRLPVLGDFFKKLYLYRFAQNFSTLFAGGVSVIESLEVTRNVIGNKVYRDILDEVKEGVEKGEQISVLLKSHSDYFPYMVIQMIAVGERTGKVSQTLQSVIKIYKKQIEESLDKYVSMIEPAMIIVLGALVGGLVASIILPIYQMGMTF